jgi:hypothetical protein
MYHRATTKNLTKHVDIRGQGTVKKDFRRKRGEPKIIPDFLPPPQKFVLLEKSQAPAIANVSKRGFWLVVRGRKLFLSIRDFPWFEGVSISKLRNVMLHQAHHLYWPDLDVDLSLESIEHPGRFPLVTPRRKNAKQW